MLTAAVQCVSRAPGLPSAELIQSWAEAAYTTVSAGGEDTEVTVRIVDEQESGDLNRRFRQRDGATNVLSFSFTDPPGVVTGLLGDIVVCAPIVDREAAEQNKPAHAHWAHMIVHGVLHLCGYDHECDADARQMETLETRILTRLGFAQPYADADV